MKAFRIILATICTLSIAGLVWLLGYLAAVLAISIGVWTFILLAIAVGGTAIACVVYLIWEGFMNFFKKLFKKKD